MIIVKGNFINGSAVVYKKENGFLVKGLQFENGTIQWLPYWYTGDFFCNRAVVDTQKGMGYIDRKGNVIVPPNYFVADDYSEDRAFVSTGNDTIVIDPLGKIIKRFEECFVTSKFQNGTAILSRIVNDGKETEEAVIDRNGVFITEFANKRKIENIVDIHIHSQDLYWHEGVRKFSRKGKLGVHDRNGNEIVSDFMNQICLNCD